MLVRLDTKRLQTLDQIREYAAGSRPFDVQPHTRAEACAFGAETLERFAYPSHLTHPSTRPSGRRAAVRGHPPPRHAASETARPV